MTRNIGWELYRSFLAVLQEGSLSAAARSLGLTQPTIGRHVSALERALGLSLFTRSQAGLQATEAALALREDAELMRSTAAALERAARGLGQAVQGAVRISASEVIGVEVLPPILAALQAQHPRLEIELVLSNRVQDLVRREADIAVRMTAPRQDVLLATRVGEVSLGLHAHRRYLERHGEPTKLADLAGHRLIGFDQETPFLRAAGAGLPAWSREQFAARCDSDLGQLALLRAGLGIGICQLALARRDPDLVRLLPQKFLLALDSWIVMHEGLRSSPRCRVTFDALVRGLRDYTAPRRGKAAAAS
ncbi:LysR family transcriptional regulator [Roseateles sp. DAIF2]|uniref:LysR family transcriptional regulator n=1 Tax=Roseateles sp. DAIF2 TaxID=2714952 RepID=UPI0018A2B6DB|nr:LysR family transcriptional regulator [Roseateles sp. DAIF2]QPF75315.1 LysR family transcriptional regulator [Roseateles sp. DAIF2]